MVSYGLPEHWLGLSILLEKEVFDPDVRDLYGADDLSRQARLRVARRVEDVYGTVAGLAAHVTVDGGTCGALLTGRDDFEFGNVSLEPDLSGIAVEAPHQYHNPPGSLAAAGAEYVWWDADATVLGSADFSVDIDVP